MHQIQRFMQRQVQNLRFLVQHIRERLTKFCLMKTVGKDFRSASDGLYQSSGQATIVETAREKVDRRDLQREEVVRFALQFVGNPYVYGGTDPNRGADCSGFTSYVMRHTSRCVPEPQFQSTGWRGKTSFRAQAW